jgi:hypothetical protein
VAPQRFRVIRDPEGWPVIPRKRGRIEWHDERAVAVYSDRSRLWQTGPDRIDNLA